MVICFLGFPLEWKARSMERGWRREIWEKQWRRKSREVGKEREERRRASEALGEKRRLPRKFVDYAEIERPLSEILKGNERTKWNFLKRPSILFRNCQNTRFWTIKNRIEFAEFEPYISCLLLFMKYSSRKGVALSLPSFDHQSSLLWFLISSRGKE